MDKKQGFFSALREEVARGLSPARARRRSQAAAAAEVAAALRAPDPESGDGGKSSFVGGGGEEGRVGPLGCAANFSRAPLTAGAAVVAAGCCGGAARRNDLRLLLGVMGAPLGPVHVAAGEPLPHLSIKDTPIETSSAQYILQQYLAASGGQKLLSSVRNSYAMGKVRMVATEFETGGRVVRNRMAARATESGRFVLWQMAPEMWYIELAVGGSKVHAGCNGKLVWRHTPWLGAHSAKGPVRPLRRALQGLDPLTAASMFAARRLASLWHLEDLTSPGIQSTTGGDAVYWETTINSFIEDYRPVEGIMVAHAGRSAVTLFRFGEVAMSHTKTRMEEAWSIEEVAFNVPGLSIDCFIPPTDIKSGSISETVELPHGEKSKVGLLQCHSAKVAALEKADDNVAWSGALQRDFK
ncbi:hypothetical protein OsJ_36659 [Oryza sativa Japonica Group]|uniref:Uncharacterized protein n=1 Tax=Oryza sativa subsp. japonica TaxID=39947 RepID=B9GDZ2_ORYSJ|nr:hypothetical protein OsJ_36659 [Oryza sativa Japonica Group]